MGKIYIVRTLGEYINIIKEITTEIKEVNPRYEVWFRGQGNCNYDLSPKGLRNIKRKNTGQFMKKDEDVQIPDLKNILQNFKRRSINNLDSMPKSEIEWLIIAQHYGLATKLLDWTTNALIGLYFSLPDKKTLDNVYDISFEELFEIIEDNNLQFQKVKNLTTKELYYMKHYEGNDIDDINSDKLKYRSNVKNAAAVYVMSPNILNRESVNKDFPIYVGDDNVESDMKYFIDSNSQNSDIKLKSISDDATNEFPICINCNEIDKRIRNQSGCFTLHGYHCAPLDFYTIFESNIHKIYIPYSSVEFIKKELKECGIDKYFVYQDLNSLSDEINEEELELFKKSL